MLKLKVSHRFLLFSLIILGLFFFTACALKDGREAKAKADELLIDGSPLLEEGSLIRIENRPFIRLDIVKRYRDIHTKLQDARHITHFVNLNDLKLREEIKNLFYNPKAVIFSLPLIKRGGHDYIDVDFLIDFMGFTKLDFEKTLILFSPSYDKKPNRVGLLNKTSKIVFMRNGSEISLNPGRDQEIYFYEEEGLEELEFYSEDHHPARCKRGDVNYISKLEDQKTLLEPRPLKTRYNKHLMAFDDIPSYEGSLDYSLNQTYAGLNILLPKVLALKEEKIISSQSGSAMAEMIGRGLDVIAVLELRADTELKKILKDDFALKSTIDSLLLHALYYGYSGIDVDVSQLREEDVALTSSFLAGLSSKLKQADLIFTLNLYPGQPTTYELGLSSPLNTAVDYYIAMLMDEDILLNSPYPGQRPKWVEEELISLLKQLPAEKLILAQGLYVRAYEIAPDSSKPKSKLVFPAKDLFQKTDGLVMETRRDEDLEQVYYKYKNPDGEGHYILWMDDEESFSKKLALIPTKNIQGLALWTYSMLDEEIMATMRKALFLK